MVTAYTAFSNKGVRVDPLYVTRIEDNLGNVIAEFTSSMTEVFSEQAYYRILPMLKDVIDHGTGGRVRFRYGITAPMGGKTGTTNNNSDGWFMGFTPDLVSGVWVGGEDRSIHFVVWPMGREPVWHCLFMVFICRKFMGIKVWVTHKIATSRFLRSIPILVAEVHISKNPLQLPWRA